MLAFNEDLYDLLKYTHVLGAITWVGAGIFIQYYATRLSRAKETQKLAGFAKDIEKAGTQLAMPASLLALLAGIVMVAYSPAIAFRDLWILAGLVGYAATFVTGAFFLGPLAGKIGDAIDEKGIDDPDVSAMVSRIFTVSRVDLVVLLLVIAAMVFKPGA